MDFIDWLFVIFGCIFVLVNIFCILYTLTDLFTKDVKNE